MNFLNNVVVARSQEDLVLPVARVYVSMPPAIFFTDNEKGFPAIKPLKAGIFRDTRNNPGWITLVEDLGAFTRLDVEEKKLPLIAETAQLFHEQLIRIPRPLNHAEIDSVLRSRNREPTCLAGNCLDHSDFQHRNRSANTSETHLPNLRITRISRNDHRTQTHLRRVRLHKGD